MFDMWDTELEPEAADEMIERAATAIEKRGMTTPAIMALEMHKPLAGVGAQAALVFAPFMVPLVGFDAVNDYSRLIRNRDNIEKLLKRLECPTSVAPLQKDDSI